MSGYDLLRNLETSVLFRDIRRIVAEAKANGEVLRAGFHAGVLYDAFPNCGLSVGRIVDEITLEAMRSGVPVEIATPDRNGKS